ncbi:hypothetical protein CFK37_06900 [Virgibacillus phasianinus]|uniref:DUF302 domain-containing protein n=1 Tax=Virgibacillus phasianinus TaxID=2017483 RepID=A0A220U1V0_9BACI|nr:DUF302 domain-containing protein [Virgibacillus phasianinus]ASK61906.1 hypothetical protein CFK37_06900 [Virgibacillus phasianinus]
MFHYTVETKKTMEEAIQALENNLKTEGFGVLWQFDIKETLQNKGFDFNQSYQVLEVCSPKEAYHMLTKNQMVGYFLPCKMVVYEDTGKIKIGMPRPTVLVEMVEDESIKEKAAEIENKLIVCMDQSI